MKCNVGTVDRIARAVIGLGLLSLFFTLEGDIHYIGLIGLIPLATAVVGFCPMYCPFKINTMSCCSSKDGGEKSCCGGGKCDTDATDKDGV